MDTKYTTRIQCMNCGSEQEIEAKDIFLHAEDPAQREQAMSLQDIIHFCKECQSPLLCCSRVLYIDDEKKFMVRYTPLGSEPIACEEKEDYTLRDVFSPLAFREKVHILSHDLEDVVVELLKIVTVRANPEIDFDALYCSDVKADRLVMRALCANVDDMTFFIPMEGYEKMLQELVEQKGEDWHIGNGFQRVSRFTVAKEILGYNEQEILLEAFFGQ